MHISKWWEFFLVLVKLSSSYRTGCRLFFNVILAWRDTGCPSTLHSWHVSGWMPRSWTPYIHGSLGLVKPHPISWRRCGNSCRLKVSAFRLSGTIFSAPLPKITFPRLMYLLRMRPLFSLVKWALIFQVVGALRFCPNDDFSLCCDVPVDIAGIPWPEWVWQCYDRKASHP